MNTLTSEVYLHFIIVAIFSLSSAALVIGVFSLKSGLETYRYWRSRDITRAVYSFWRLLRTAIAYVALMAFWGVPLVVLLIPDADDPIRLFLTRHLLIVVVLGLSALVISEPLSERRVDRAIADEERYETRNQRQDARDVRQDARSLRQTERGSKQDRRGEEQDARDTRGGKGDA